MDSSSVDLFSLSFVIKCSYIVLLLQTSITAQATAFRPENPFFITLFTYYSMLIPCALIMSLHPISLLPPPFLGTKSPFTKLLRRSFTYIVSDFLVFLSEQFSLPMISVIRIASYIKEEKVLSKSQSLLCSSLICPIISCYVILYISKTPG